MQGTMRTTVNVWVSGEAAAGSTDKPGHVHGVWVLSLELPDLPSVLLPPCSSATRQAKVSREETVEKQR